MPTKEPTPTASSLARLDIGTDLSERAEALLDNTGGVLDVTLLPQIKPPSGSPPFVWSYSLLGTDRSGPALELVALASTKARAYWSQPLGLGDVFPDCSSKDGIRGVGVPGGACATCPMSEWGSALPRPGQKAFEKVRGQACREFRFLPALVLPEMVLALVRVPPTSTRAVDAYVQDLALAGHRLSHVVTRATLERDESAGGIAFASVKLAATAKVEDPAHLKALADIATMVRSASVGSIVAETALSDA